MRLAYLVPILLLEHIGHRINKMFFLLANIVVFGNVHLVTEGDLIETCLDVGKTKVTVRYGAHRGDGG